MKAGSPPIQFVYHLGVHCTDEGQLLDSLLKNAEALAEKNVVVPPLKAFRARIGELVKAQKGEAPDDATQQAFLDQVLGGQTAERVVFSHQNFLAMPSKVMDQGRLYPRTQHHAQWLRQIFPENPCEFFLAIRNPATFLPAAMQAAKAGDVDSFTHGANPAALRWSGVVLTLQETNPGCPITVWCNEDTPLIWPEILREIAGVGPVEPMEGEFDVLETIMEPEGFKRMQNYLSTHPPTSAMQRRRVTAAFLDKFAIDDAIVEEVDVPGWTPEFVDEISQTYDEDVDQIAQIPGVRLIGT